MLSIERAFASDRLMRALTGLNQPAFEKLLPSFETILNDKPYQKPRLRRPGGGKKHTLSTSRDKLFFILFYAQCYPTFDVASFLFEVNRSQTNRWVQRFLPVLEEALQQAIVLPERKIENVEAFFHRFPEVKDLFLDGTERATQRPQDKEQQKKYYSGKKKGHTRKNLILNDEKKRVLLLSATESGSHHDYAMFKKAAFPEQLPEGIQLWLDLGFQGIQKNFPQLKVRIPHKKPRGGELSEEQKLSNTTKATKRVIAEHTIGGIKRLNFVSQVFRNRKENFDDQFMLIACGIWNFHLKFS